MSEEEKSELLNIAMDCEIISNGIRDRFDRYKTADKYFFVPVNLYFHYDGKLDIEIGDKSFTSIEELRRSIEAWCFGKVRNPEQFVEVLWANRDKNINVFFLIENDEYNFGSVVSEFPQK